MAAAGTISNRVSASSSRNQSFGHLPSLNVHSTPKSKPFTSIDADRVLSSDYKGGRISSGRKSEIRNTFSSTYQAAALRLYEDREKTSFVNHRHEPQKIIEHVTEVQVESEEDEAPEEPMVHKSADATEHEKTDRATSTKKLTTMTSFEDSRQLARQDARRRWRKIKTRIDEVRAERQAVKGATGWESIFKRVREMVTAERARRDLYERYGFEGLPLGRFPRSNPMSLYPADEFPTGEEREIPASVASLIRRTRYEVSKLYMQGAFSRTASRASSVSSTRSSRFSKFLNEHRPATQSTASHGNSRATTAKSFGSDF